MTEILMVAAQTLRDVPDRSAPADRVLELVDAMLSGARTVSVQEAEAARAAVSADAADWRRKTRMFEGVRRAAYTLSNHVTGRQCDGDQLLWVCRALVAARRNSDGDLPSEVDTITAWAARAVSSTALGAECDSAMDVVCYTMAVQYSVARSAEFACRVAWHLAAAVEAVACAVEAHVLHARHTSDVRAAAEVLLAAGNPIPGQWLDDGYIAARDNARTAAFCAANAAADVERWTQRASERAEAAIRVAAAPPWSLEGQEVVDELHRLDLSAARVAANGGSRYGAVERAAAAWDAEVAAEVAAVLSAA